jgi:transcriptional regulator with XRE-family HTH domain
MTNLSDWLVSEMESRGLTAAKLSIKMGKNPGVISRILNGSRTPSNDTIESLAKALDIPASIVYQKAGLSLTDGNVSSRAMEVDHLLNQIPESERDGIIDLIRLQIKLFKKKGKNEVQKRPAENLR